MTRLPNAFFWQFLLAISLFGFFSCEKDDQQFLLEMEEPPSDIITQINHPSNFNTCYGAFNFPPEQPWGWLRVQVNGEWHHGLSYMVEFPQNSNIWNLRYFLYNYETCWGSYSGDFSNIPLALSDPRHDWPFVTLRHECSDTVYSLPLGKDQRRIDFSVLNHDTPLQIMVADTSSAYRTQLVIDQVDTLAGFVRGRFAARFYANPQCDPSEMLESEVLLENGYFEASLLD